MSKRALIDFDAPLRHIHEASVKLNRAAEVATKDIERLEKELLQAEPGVSVWTDAIAESEEQYVSDDGQTQTGKRVTKLGFAKVAKWGITVSQELFDAEGRRLDRDLSLLRKAERDLRLLGREHIGLVLEALRGALEERLAKLPQPQGEPSDAELNVEPGEVHATPVAPTTSVDDETVAA